ncbi:hypothetical protein GCM10010987_36760 [Bradyrhizobium guangdongense]|uniref:Uncharacterized protein n=1 Tax=Bradyrhizobium guangdongense TaxID=1325090 RepID=A0AA88B8S5_9BRAD|nr:hypothetical protein GCM10010987_36760 [Bradyrhizobium guangdongense]
MAFGSGTIASFRVLRTGLYEQWTLSSYVGTRFWLSAIWLRLCLAADAGAMPDLDETIRLLFGNDLA